MQPPQTPTDDSPAPGLNPGIIATVRWLAENGFQTTDSGDGRTHDHDCDLPMPYVHMLTTPEKLIAETDRLAALLLARGVKLEPMNEDGTAPALDATYAPASRSAIISLFNVRL